MKEVRLIGPEGENIGTISIQEALRVDSMSQNAMVGMAAAYMKSGQPERSLDYVTKLRDRTAMGYQYFQQATEKYLEAGYEEQALQAFEHAIERGLSPSEVQSMTDQYPQLAK